MDLQFPEISARYTEDPKGAGSEPLWDSKYEANVTRWTSAAYEEAELDRKQNEELKYLGKYIDYIEGRQWSGQRASYKSKPVNNKVVENFWELVGLLTDIKPIQNVRTENPDPKYTEAAKVTSKGIRYWAGKTAYDLTLAFNIAYAVLTTSFCKWQWNPELSHGNGELQALPLGPRDVLMLKPKHDLQSSLCVMKDEWVTMGWLRRRFPSRGHLAVPNTRLSTYSIDPGAPTHLPAFLWDVMSDGMKRKLGGEPEAKTSAFPMTLYREYWFRDFSTNPSNVPITMGRYNWRYVVPPLKPLYPRGRLICTGGGKIMDDIPNPYWHGLYPFTLLRLNAVPWSIFGLSDVKGWLNLQDILNQILAGIIDMIKRAVNPGMVAPRQAFTEEVWKSLDFSKPGERAAYSMAAGNKPDWVPAPVLPGYVSQMYQMIERTLDQLSGKAAAQALMSKKQVPGSDAIESLQSMRATPVRLKSRNIERFIEDGGNQQVSNMFQFYDQKRRMHLWGAAGNTPADFDWDPGTMIPAGTEPEEFVKAMQYSIMPGSLLNSDKRQKINDASMLRARGDLSRKTYYEIIDDGLDLKTEEAELKREMQEKIAMIPPKGKAAKGAAR